MKYSPYGPTEIPRFKSRIDETRVVLNDFWDELDNENKGISNTVGCYIFSIRVGKGILPWYVGLAEKQSFRNECFTDHKLVKFNRCLSERKGTPVLTLIPRHTETGRFSRTGKNGYRDVRFLENILIASCLERNPKLLNIKQTSFLKNMVVTGLLNTPRGKTGATVNNFKNLIGV